MITSIIFSKDRPLQLDLTIRSVKKNLPLCSSIAVIYKTNYEQSYEILMQEHKDVVFIKQGMYLLDSILECKGTLNKFATFLTDDNIVYRPSTLTADQLRYIDIKVGCCISLRLGINTNKRDFGDGILRNDSLPYLSVVGGLMSWDRLSIPPGGYWAYPLSVDGHIFSVETLSVILNTMRNWPETFSALQTPNKFEALLQRFFFEVPVVMFSEKYSCVVNSPNNRVQAEYANANGLQFSYSPDVLNDLFLQGKRIDLNKLDFSNIVCPHQEVDLMKGLYEI